MKPRGFFGAIMILAGIGILLAMNSFSANYPQKYQATENKLLEMKSAALQRAQAEAYLDRKIEDSLAFSMSPPVEAQKTKIAVNSAIVEAFTELGLEGHICEHKSGSEKITGRISVQSLDAVSKVLVAKLGNFTIAQYTISGGEMGKSHICTEIKNGKYSLRLRLPRGYTTYMAVPWQ